MTTALEMLQSFRMRLISGSFCRAEDANMILEKLNTSSDSSIIELMRSVAPPGWNVNAQNYKFVRGRYSYASAEEAWLGPARFHALASRIAATHF